MCRCACDFASVIVGECVSVLVRVVCCVLCVKGSGLCVIGFVCGVCCVLCVVCVLRFISSVVYCVDLWCVSWCGVVWCCVVVWNGVV